MLGQEKLGSEKVSQAGHEKVKLGHEKLKLGKVKVNQAGHDSEGSEISGQLKENSGNFNHSGRENFNQAKEIVGKVISGHENDKSGNLSHAGRENLSHSKEIVGQVKEKVSQAGHESSGKLILGQEKLGKLNFGNEGSVSLGRESLGRERFWGGSR
jgi:hypothetical protein